MYFKIILFALFAFVGKSLGSLRCYGCSFSSSDSDKSCLIISETTNIVDCPFTYCTVYRQEYMDPSGVVVSFNRGCEQQPDYLNHEVADNTFRTFYRACTSDLCNIGDGIESVVAGNLSPTPLYNGQNLLVPGTGSSGNTLKTSFVTIFIIGVILYFV